MFCASVTAPSARQTLTDRVPYGFRPFADNRQHRVVEGDTLWGLAGHYFAPLPRACGLWWVIADFQPQPIHDPTLRLEPGELLWIPAQRVLQDVIFSPLRRQHDDAP
jgi:nucleoid-associated protein YgaU